MTTSHVVRAVLFCFGVIVAGASLGEMWHGPRRGMTWAQFLRYTSLATIVVTLMVAQYVKRNVPITGFTVAIAIGVVIGSLGVLPFLRKPILPTRSPDAARTRPKPL